MKREIYIDTISGEILVKEIYYYDIDSVENERYYLNNNLHRVDGSATIWYNKNGTVAHECHYLNGKEVMDYLRIEEINKIKNPIQGDLIQKDLIRENKNIKQTKRRRIFIID